jgi:hypothetical protein
MRLIPVLIIKAGIFYCADVGGGFSEAITDVIQMRNIHFFCQQ